MKKFWAKVEQGSDDECWEWTGSVMSAGYGKITWRNSDYYQRGAHQMAWEIEHGEPPEQNVLHTCDNKLCVNPKHLKTGGQAENLRDHFKRSDDAALGEKNHATKLSEENVREIREKLNTNATLREIAQKYGVSHTTISAIKTGDTWKHVD